MTINDERCTTWIDYKFQRASACGRDKKTCKRLGRWLIKKLRLLTTEAQSSLRRSEFLSIQPEKAHPIASGIVVSVRSSSVRSATLWFYSRKPPGFHHCSMLPPQSHRGEQFPLFPGPFVLRVLVVFIPADHHGNNRSKSF